jgi:outer membrane lipoprotein-sorting protein
MKQLLAVIAVVACVRGAEGQELTSVLARIDAAAHGFSGVSARMTSLAHTAVLNDDTTESGSFHMQRKGKDVRALVDFSAEKDKRIIFFADKALQIYYPNLQLVQVYDLGTQAKVLDQYLLLGFGTSAKELEAGYNIKLLGIEKVDGKDAARLELEPKDAAARDRLVKAEIWIPEDSGLPVQQKFYQKNGNFTLVKYSGLQSTSSSDKPLKLTVPEATKTEHPH